MNISTNISGMAGASSPASRGRRLVAFGQSLVFLLIGLLVCATAGAAEPPKKSGFNPTLHESVYGPTKTRDPFIKAGTGVTAERRAAPVDASSFQLQGILYQASNPSAIVSGHLLTLNKTVHFDPAGANTPVKAVAITRQHVVLEVNGQKVELHLEPPKGGGATPATP